MKRQESEGNQATSVDKEAELLKSELIQLICQHVPNYSEIDPSEITVERAKEGMGNLVYRVKTANEDHPNLVVKKFLSAGEDAVKINIYEREVLQHLIKVEYGAKIYFSSHEKGYEIQECRPGSCLNPALFKDEKLMAELVQEIARFEEKMNTISNEPNGSLNTKNQVLDILDHGIDTSLRNEYKRLIELDRIDEGVKQRLTQIMEIFDSEDTRRILDEASRDNYPFIMSHADLNIFNILFDEKSTKFTLLDFEYSCFNPIGYDLAYFIMGVIHNFGHPEAYFRPENFPDEEKLGKLVDAYLAGFENLQKLLTGFDANNGKKIVLDSIKRSCILVNVFWIIWSMFKIDDPNAPFNWNFYLQSRIDQHNFIIDKYFS